MRNDETVSFFNIKEKSLLSMSIWFAFNTFGNGVVISDRATQNNINFLFFFFLAIPFRKSRHTLWSDSLFAGQALQSYIAQFV